MREQRTLFDLTQDGWGIGKKIQRIYPKFDVSTFVSDGDGGVDTLQRDESHRSRPAPASTERLFRCACYFDDVRRDRDCIETDTTPDRRRRFPTKFLPPLNLSLGAGTQNDH